MVLLNPIPLLIASKIMRVKLEFNIAYDAFIIIYKVDYSDKIVCFIENRHITGLIIIVWNNEDDINPNEHLVVLKFYQKVGGPIINSNELAQCIIIQQLDKDNYEIKTAQSINIYIYNLNIFTIRDFIVYKGKLYLLKKQYTTELSYQLLLNEFSI
jgi:hypothetical protein